MRGAERLALFGVAGVAHKPNFELTFSSQPSVAPRSPPRKFFSASAIAKVQLILRCCLSSQGVVGVAHKPKF